MFGRTTVLIALVLALALPAAAPARQAASLTAPTGLKAFLISYDETTPTRNGKISFTRTPSFGWKLTPRATSYDFQLATSSSFRENSFIWSTDGLAVPYTGVPIALPWITGHDYSLFARVRAHIQGRTTPWSVDYAFNVQGEAPKQLSAPNGLLRWTPIDGATSYQVWELNITGNGANQADFSSEPCLGLKSGPRFYKCYTVATNVTDMRDWFTFHRDASWVGTANWRVRAVRELNVTAPSDGLPVTTYGPWSPVFTTSATTPSVTTVALGETVSDVIGTTSNPAPHSLMPGFNWSGTTPSSGESTELYRVYVYSDDDCVNPVMVGSVVGSPAWVPRMSGALALPSIPSSLFVARGQVLADGAQGGAWSSSFDAVTPNEDGAATDTLDLWDRKWPSGVYYWTVVPVRMFVDGQNKLEYQDTEVPQDVCESGRIGTFGKVGAQVETGNKKAYVTSLALAGKVSSTAASSYSRVYGNTPLLTWTPVLAADKYEVQWSGTRYPFVMAGSVIAQTTSATLTLAPGVWYYRVRGIDLQVAKSQSMGWSSVRKLKILKPTFRISR
jgi:hypothetical protein